MIDLVLAGDALVDGPVDGVDQIIVHLAGELVRRLLDERFPEARRPAIVDREDGIPAVGQPLMRGVVAVAVARPWPGRLPIVAVALVVAVAAGAA